MPVTAGAMKLNERSLLRLATDHSKGDQEGFLLKKGELNKGFQRRYFVLRGNLLFYFEKEHDREPVGVIIVENCRIELCTNEVSPFAFQILFDGIGTRTYVLSAESEESMNEWMTKLIHAKYIYLKTLVTDLDCQLKGLQDKESRMTPDALSDSESDTELPTDTNSLSKELDETDGFLAKPPVHSRTKMFNKTLPSRLRQRSTSNNSWNRWSLSASPPGEINDFSSLSDQTNFLWEPQPGREARSSFTSPSFSELRNNEEIQDNSIIDFSETDENKYFDKKVDINTLSDKLKVSSIHRRVKSERYKSKPGSILGTKKDHRGSLSNSRRGFSDDLSNVEENVKSKFQHLHRVWGATIWTKVKEFEIQSGRTKTNEGL